MAHADLLLQIDDLTARIEAAPDDPDLYLRRADLHRRHANWPAALADYQRAAALAADRSALDYLVGRIWLDAGRPRLAAAAFGRVLMARPDDSDALVLRSRAYAALGLSQAAARDLRAAVDLSETPRPELFVELAQLLAGTEPARLEDALGALDDGIARIGPIVTLVELAVELERRRGAPQAALRRLRVLPLPLRQRPNWLARRGNLLVAAGQVDDARAAYAAALAAIDQLPAARRMSQAMIELRHRIQRQLARWD